MPTISDPTSLDKEELLAEWAVREEELRLQFESLRTAQTQSQVLLQRYERIFAFCPLPLLVIDSRALVREVNQAARQLFGDRLQESSSHLPHLLDDPSKLKLAQTLRGFMNDNAAKAQQLQLEFREGDVAGEALVVALDTQMPPESYVVMLMLPTPEGARSGNAAAPA